MNVCRDDAGLLGRLQNHGARAVAEQHCRRAILPVRQARQRLRTDDEHVLAPTGTNVPVRKVETVDEAAACRLDIECAAAADAEAPLHDAGRSREDFVRGRRGNDDQVDIFRGKASHIDRFPGSGEREIRCRLIVGGYVPPLDPCALLDPFVRGIHHLREVMIRHDFFGQIATGAGDT